ncbi:MAG TPA: pseudouridine synthase [Bacteroidales bacterium]|nr:pseudouridine synthase [Bacteroidales bacterium]
MTNRDNWQEKPDEGASSARRDGDHKNSFDKPRRTFGNNGDRSSNAFSDRPKRDFRSDSGNKFFAGDSDRPRRPREDSGNRFDSDRPRRSFGSDSSSDRPRRSFGEDSNFDRPRRSFGGDSSSDRPRRSFGDDSNFDRPRRSFGSDSNSDRPRRSFGGDSYSDRPSFRGPSIPRPDRADGRPRRPRIKRENSFDHGSPFGSKPSHSHPVQLDPTVPLRLNKFLANAGICSRREADEFIQAGVVKVNGEAVTELGVKVLPTDTIMFHDQTVSIERKVYILLNKPKDCVTTSDDPQERTTVMDLVKGACYERIYPVGRLDRNTTGVLLLTNDGELASKLTHPKYEKRKIYQVTLERDLEEADFKAILAGIRLDDELIQVDNLSFVDADNANVVGIEIHSGQNRVVRRIFESFGYKVFKLDRVYFAGLTKKNLPRGKWRHLTDKEVGLLKMGAFA